MTRTDETRRMKALVWFMAGLLLFLSAGVTLLIFRQRSLVLDELRTHENEELSLLQSIVSQSISHKDYASIERYLKTLAGIDEGPVQVRVLAPDGSVLAQYTRIAPSGDSIVLTKPVDYNGRRQATLEATIGLHPLYRKLGIMTLQYFGASILFAGVMGAVLWNLLRKTAFIPLENSLQEVRNSNETLEQWVNHRTAELLRTNTELLIKDRAIATSMNGIAFADFNGGLTYVNEAFLALWGYADHREVLGRNAVEFLQGPEAGNIVKTLHVRGSWHGELVGRKKDGSFFDAQITADVVLDKEGAPICMMASFLDVTERKRVQAALKRERDFITTVLNTQSSMVLVLDRNGRIIRFNRQCERVSGYTFDEVRERYVWDFLLPPEQIESVKNVFRNLAAGRFPNRHENYWIAKDGTPKLIDWSNTCLVDAQGAVEYVIPTGIDITESRKVHEELLESEARRRMVVENINEIIYLMTLSGDPVFGSVVFVGGQTESIIGHKAGEFLEDPGLWRRLIHPNDIAAVREATHGVLNSGEAGLREYRVRNAKTGEFLWIEDRIVPQLDEKGRVKGYFGSARDMTARKRAEQRLREHSRHAMLAADTGIALTRMDDLHHTLHACAEAQVRHLDAFFARIWILDADESTLMLQASAGAYSHLDGPHSRIPLGRYKIGRIALERRPHLTNDVINDPLISDPEWAKREGIVSFAGHPLIVEDKLVGVMGIFAKKELSKETLLALSSVADVIALGIVGKKTGETLLEEKNRLKALIAVSQGITSTTEPGKLYRRIIAEAKDILRFDCSTFLVLSDDKRRLTIQDTIGFPEAMISAFTLGEGQGLASYVIKNSRHGVVLDFAAETRFEVPAVIREKNIRSALCVPMMIENEMIGALIGHTFNKRAFTEDEIFLFQSIANQAAIAVQHARHFQELMDSGKELQTLVTTVSRSRREWRDTFDSITDMIFIHDENLTITKANTAFARYHDLVPREVIGKKCYDLFLKRRLPERKCPHEAALVDSTPLTEEITDPDTGRVLRISTFPSIVKDGETEAKGVIHVIRDITEEREKEMRLIMSERLASLGQMASSIAHEINNPLAAIAGCADGLTRRIKKEQYDPEVFKRYLTIIKDEITRTKNITTDMLSYVRKTALDRHLLDIHTVLDKALEIISLQGRLKDIQVARQYGEAIPRVPGSDGELRQVFLSIITNAVDAMKDQGGLSISTGMEEQQVWIRISDTGPGVSLPDQGRIFDPFFTTKAATGGTGLGLAIATKIITAHRGAIRVLSEKDRGATFKVTLPLS